MHDLENVGYLLLCSEVVLSKDKPSDMYVANVYFTGEMARAHHDVIIREKTIELLLTELERLYFTPHKKRRTCETG